MAAYVFTTLDDPNAGTQSGQGTTLSGINNSGQLVGSYLDANTTVHDLLYSGGVFTTLNPPTGSNFDGATILGGTTVGLNNTGEIVGSYFDAAGFFARNSPAGELGFSYAVGSAKYTSLSDPSGPQQTYAGGINDNDVIAGYYLDSSNIDHAFVFSNGAYTSIPEAPGAGTGAFEGTQALGVNNGGQIIGAIVSGTGRGNGFLYSNGVYTVLHDPAAASGTFPTGINSAGQIVGYYFDATGVLHGFLDVSGTYTTIDDPNAGTSSQGSTFQGTLVTGINDSGDLVGTDFDGKGVAHGFTAQPQGSSPTTPTPTTPSPATPVPTPTGDITLADTTTGKPIAATGSPYSGPVSGLQHQYIYSGTDDVNIAVTDDNWFLKGGPGEDALQAFGGYNVVDGSTGSNFLTGGSGTDTFFVDDRSPPSDIWSTVNNFHQGDDATVFGIVQSPAIQWFDNQGAPGFTGLTLHIFGQNAPTASLTLVGYSSADLNNGRLTVQFGNEADGTPFMHIIGTG